MLRNAILLLSGLGLISCTSSTQANRAIGIGAAILGTGVIMSSVGYARSVDEDLSNNSKFLLPIGLSSLLIGEFTFITGAISQPLWSRVEGNTHNINRLSSRYRDLSSTINEIEETISILNSEEPWQDLDCMCNLNQNACEFNLQNSPTFICACDPNCSTNRPCGSDNFCDQACAVDPDC